MSHSWDGFITVTDQELRSRGEFSTAAMTWGYATIRLRHSNPFQHIDFDLLICPRLTELRRRVESAIDGWRHWDNPYR